ncbi:MAG: hypothetical protein AAGN15_24035 [Cyanobacteria bacterium J06581_3]
MTRTAAASSQRGKRNWHKRGLYTTVASQQSNILSLKAKNCDLAHDNQQRS